MERKHKLGRILWQCLLKLRRGQIDLWLGWRDLKIKERKIEWEWKRSRSKLIEIIEQLRGNKTWKWSKRGNNKNWGKRLKRRRSRLQCRCRGGRNMLFGRSHLKLRSKIKSWLNLMRMRGTIESMLLMLNENQSRFLFS